VKCAWRLLSARNLSNGSDDARVRFRQGWMVTNLFDFDLNSLSWQVCLAFRVLLTSFITVLSDFKIVLALLFLAPERRFCTRDQLKSP
jgi:hypothetical protein